MSIFEAPIRLPLAKKSNRLIAERKKKHKLIQNHRMVVYMNIKQGANFGRLYIYIHFPYVNFFIILLLLFVYRRLVERQIGVLLLD
jgi:hypothetical protein